MTKATKKSQTETQTPDSTVPAPATVQPVKSTNELAIASLIVGILGFLWILPIVGSILGIILGSIALSQIKQGKGTGRGLAHTGLWLGVSSLVLTTIVAAILVAMVPILISNSDTVLTNSSSAADIAKKVESHIIVVQLESYHAEKGYYPAQLSDIPDFSVPTFAHASYTYEPSPTGCVGSADAILANPNVPLCIGYTVKVVLDDGSEYVKENIKTKTKTIPIPSVNQTQSTDPQTN